MAMAATAAIHRCPESFSALPDRRLALHMKAKAAADVARHASLALRCPPWIHPHHQATAIAS
jgi:hypothetical protein